MVEKLCARSHGHPVPGVRSAAIISMRRVISFEGVTFVMPDDPLGRRRCYQAGATPCKPICAAMPDIRVAPQGAGQRRTAGLIPTRRSENIRCEADLGF